jgi:addiction module HigA family antidote
MYAKAVETLPESSEWIYEIKFDGYRALAGKGSSGVTIWSRRGNEFTDQFPRIARACQRLQPDTLIDVNERAAISPEIAIRLSKAFGSSPEVWLGMQMEYDLAQAEKSAGKIKVERITAEPRA